MRRQRCDNHLHDLRGRQVYERVTVRVDEHDDLDLRPSLHPWLLAAQDVDTGEFPRIPLHLSSGDSERSSR
jgi:hypothetical protein